MKNNNRKVIVFDLLNWCKKIIHTILGDQDTMLSVLVSVNKWTDDMRSPRTVDFSFSIPDFENNRQNVNALNLIIPLNSVIKSPNHT